MTNERMSIVLESRVPIIIPVWNCVEFTKQAVETIKRNTHPNLYEVIFVDNGSTDGTKDFLRQLVQDDPEHFRAITNSENKGFAGGVNTGLRAISTLKWEYACVANNDLLFTPNWLAQLIECHQQASIQNLGAVGPMSNAAGGVQGMQVGYKTIPEVDNWCQSWRQANPRAWIEAARLVGLCFLMTRQFFDKVGYFDERFVGGMWEDNDLCLRGTLAGFKYAVDRSTVLHHFMSRTFNGNNMNGAGLFRDNKKRYYDKWKEKESPFEEMALKNAQYRAGTDKIPTPPVGQDGLIKKWVVAACRVKDGAQYMERTLEGVSKIADEIVVLVSKLTTDNTKEICKKFSKVVLVEDDTDDQPGARESDSRNHVLQMAYSRHPDWIYCFDHDEVPEERMAAKLPQLTNPRNPEILLWAFPIVQLWNREDQRRVDGLWGRFWQGRMFRALPGLKIANSNNLIHCGSHPSFSPEHCGTSLVKIAHYGNVDPAVRKRKYDRYTKIDTDKDLDMVLGMWKEYYWKLYYGQPDQLEVSQFVGKWQVVHDPADWSKPKYGQFFERDAYRHVNDELGARFTPYSEHPSLSLCMLIHNEGPMLSGCIDSARNIVDEIICIDTGCTDNTPEIAEQLGAEVYEFKWVDDFSVARNFSLGKATCDWILRLDPDEILPVDTMNKIPALVRNPDAEGYIFPIMNWLEDPRANPQANWALSETCRLFKNQYPTIKYSGLVHEELDDSFIAIREKRKEELKKAGWTDAKIEERGSLLQIIRAPVVLWHYGYLRGTQVLDNKFKYYYELGNKQIKENPDDARPYFTTAVHALHVGDYQEAITRYQKSLNLDPKNHMAHNDAGVMFWTLGKLDMAEKHFRTALDIIAAGNGQVHDNHKDRVSKNLEKIKSQVLAMMLLP